MTAPEPSYKEEWAVGPRNVNFYTRVYGSANPVAAITFVHGAAEHSGRYTDLHTDLSDQNIAVFSYDLCGFGRTALDKDHRSQNSVYGKTKWEWEMDDLEWAIEQTAKLFPDVPLFIMGASMGGGQVLGLLCEKLRATSTSVKRVSGVIAASPCILLSNPPPKVGVIAFKALHHIVPYMVFPIKNDEKELSRNQETGAAYLSDIWTTRSPGSLNSIKDMVDGGETILKKGYAFWPEQVAVLFLHGTADRVTSPKATEELFNKFPAKDKKLIFYPGGYHELHNEPDGVKEKYLADVIEFVRQHVPETTN